jgi:glutathione S-transferase
MLTLWGRTNSINVMKVLWVLDEIGLKYDRVDAGMAFGVVDTLEYKAMNPNSRVPTIKDDDGTVLFESNTITRYLAARYGQPPLYPAYPPSRAKAEMWMDWQLSSLGDMTTVFWQLIRTPADKRDMAAVDRARKNLEPVWGIVDRHLATNRYLGGDEFTYGDIPVGCFVHRYLSLPMERPKLANLQAYYERLKQRPGYAKHVALPLT